MGFRASCIRSRKISLSIPSISTTSELIFMSCYLELKPANLVIIENQM
jgi:hypothetical protein